MELYFQSKNKQVDSNSKLLSVRYVDLKVGFVILTISGYNKMLIKASTTTLNQIAIVTG